MLDVKGLHQAVYVRHCVGGMSVGHHCSKNLERQGITYIHIQIIKMTKQDFIFGVC